ncbi:MAG: hypothetical protein H6573_28315 [Lewinellaceae bacterium]|nr:hypothetical protein [Phaeodactylibacter sp.]MCB9351375.1 hypothetical protein [Lewinellaceae bacterium]
MSKEPYNYTNRQGKVHYFKAIRTKKGGIRYYITKNPDSEDLITKVPGGFEVTEYPYDGRVVIRKKVPVYVTQEEVAIVQKAMKAQSPVKDFIITAEKGGIAISISQFSHYFDGLYPTAEETKELWGENVNLWKKYDWIMTFELLDKKKRSFQVIRKANVEYDAVPIDEGPDLNTLAEKYCYHIGRESLLHFWIPGED